jgi:hypothetical protein
LYLSISFFAIFILFQFIKFLLWGDAGLQFTAQGIGLLNKNYYDPTAGTETISGFINRFFENSNTYISGSFIALLGFWFNVPPENGVTAITIVYYLLFISGIIIVLRKNKFLLFTGLYAIGFLITTFFILQTIWSQLRIIIPFYPLMLIFLLSTIYYLVRIKKFSKLKLIAILFPFIILATTAFKTKEYSNKMSHSHDVYDGFTPDWVNYIKASKWSAENLPKEVIIACRKPSISFIYGKGRHFIGIDHVPSYSIESLISEWSNNRNKYIAVKTSDLSKKDFDYLASTKLNENIKATVKLEKSLFFIYEEPLYNKEKFYSELNHLTNKQIKDAGQFKNLPIKKAEVFYPDSLIRNLCRSKIQYILEASLRANVDKIDKVQNTIMRYMIFIRFRYPNMFTNVMTFGDEEPAKLIKINYENYNLPFCK